MGKLLAGEIPHLDEGYHYDGDGLRLQVRGAGHSNWSLQYTVKGKRREIGLGPLRDVGLEKARRSAAALRDKVRLGIDPLAEKKAMRVARAQSTSGPVTLLNAVRDYHENKVEGRQQKTERGAANWLSGIERHLPKALLNTPIADIRAKHLLTALEPIYKDVPDTAARIRQRLDKVFDRAVIKEWAIGNPCKAIAKELSDGRPMAENHRALPFAEAPKLFKLLTTHPGTSARALQFGMLTAARTSEILGASWSEISKDQKTWTVPAERMKMKEAHVVALSSQVQAILKQVRGLSKVWCFPSPENDAPLSNMAMLNLLDRVGVREKTTVHGLCRSTFSTWANEKGIARPDVIEACLAHKEGDKIRAAYNKAKFTAERRALLEAWGKYLTEKTK